jgi:TonB family protein
MTTNLLRMGARASTVLIQVTALLLAPTTPQVLAQSKPIPQFSLTLELMSNPQGAALKSFMSDLYKSIKDKAEATIPNNVLRGEQGVVVIQVKIQKDGSLNGVTPEKILSSGKKTLDDHAIAAVRKAAPFDHLPDSTPAPVELRVSFYYNLPPTPR